MHRHASLRGWPRLIAALLPAVFAIAAPAQTQTGSAKGAALLALTYRSAFADYKPYAEQAVTPWRQSNDTVGRVGGWRAYAKEAREPAPAVPVAPAAPAAAASRPVPASGHGGHHGGRP